MITSKKVFILYSGAGDWVGVYAPDGTLLEEGHSIEPARVAELLGFEVIEHTGTEFLEEFNAHCPEHWGEVDPDAEFLPPVTATGVGEASVPPGSDCPCGRYQDELHRPDCPRRIR